MQNVIIPSTSTRLANMLNAYKNKAAEAGVSVDVSYGTDIYIKFSAIAEALSLADQNIAFAIDSLFPSRSSGQYLEDWCAEYGLTRKQSSKSSGYITFSSTAETYVAEGTELTASSGVSYFVKNSGFYKNNQQIEIESASTGDITILSAGSTLIWSNPPVYSAPTCLTYTDIVGGAPEESDAALKSRLMTLLSQPPGSGNSANINLLATESDPQIASAFTYPCANGAGTVHVAVVNQPDFTKAVTRVVSNEGIAKASNNIYSNLPESAYMLVTSVANQQVDLSIQLSIPRAVNAKKPGNGLGWIDPMPFPYVNATNTAAALKKATLVSMAPTYIKFRSTIDPGKYYSKTQKSFTIHVWNPATFSVITTNVLSFISEVEGDHFVVTVETDKVFNPVVEGIYIFPGIQNVQNYINQVRDFFYDLGPGEKTQAPALLPRGRRRPDNLHQYSIDSKLTKMLIENVDVCLDANFNSIIDVGTNAEKTAPFNPDYPTYIYNAPNIFIPRNIGFYPTSDVL